MLLLQDLKVQYEIHQSNLLLVLAYNWKQSNLVKIKIWKTHFSISMSEVFATSVPFSLSWALSEGLLVESPTLG